MPTKLAQRAGAGDGQVTSPDGWHELAVANPTFLLERLGIEYTDLQGVRELTVNGLDAIAALGADRNGRVVRDLDWERFDASGGRMRKLSVIDTGTGTTAEQLRYYINQLAAGSRQQSSRGNLAAAERHDLANALVRAARRWGSSRVLLLDFLIATDAAAVWEARG